MIAPTLKSVARRTSLTLLALAGLALTASAQPKVHLKIAANGAAIDAFNNWTAAVKWQDIRSFRSGNASRPAVDLVLQLQALKAGGLDFDFELVRTLTYDLAKTEVIQGRADLSAETIWDNEIAAAAGLVKGPVVIRNGEFVKGVYVLPTNQKLLAVTTVEQLREHTAGVVGSWALDVKTVEEMNLKGVVKKPTPEIVFTAIRAGQADFTLGEFSSLPDMSVDLAGVKLVPVPGVKVAIAGSRSWCVAKSSPNAGAILKALEAGEKVLRENGTIEQAYKESGFFNPRVADWKRLF